MEMLDNYSEEDKARITATLKVVQSRGWSTDIADPYQFHITLGANIIESETKRKVLETDLENINDEFNQLLKDFRDMKENLGQERENKEELWMNLKEMMKTLSILRIVLRIGML